MNKGKKIIMIATVLFIVISAIFFVFKKTKFTYLSAYLPFTSVSQPNFVKENIPMPDIFYGVSVDMSQLLPTSLHYVRNKNGEDLIDIASRLGINLFRITNSQGSFDDDKDSIYTQEQWNIVLNKMFKNKIRAIVLIEANSKNTNLYSPVIKRDYITLVNNYILDSGVLDNTAVYAVDLKNEPVINKNNIGYIKEAASLIKNKYPNTNLTVGWWSVDTFKKDKNGKEIYIWDDYEAGKAFEDIVDFYSVHLYGFDKKVFGLNPDPYTFTNIFLSSVRAGLNTKKSILIEEFGAGNGDKITDQETLGSKEIQAKTFAGVYQAVRNNKKAGNLLGTVAYVFYPRDKNTDGWNILDNNGDYLYPAAYVLQEYATGENLPK